MTYDDMTFSVETIPGAKASAMFVPDSARIFREDYSTTRQTTPDGHEYIPWGADDRMPYHIIELIESDETLSTCQIWNAEMCYGEGLVYNTSQASKNVADECRDFLFRNCIAEYFLGVCQDIKHFSFAVSVITIDPDSRKISSIQRREACYCRFAPAKDGRIPHVLYRNFRRNDPAEKTEVIPLLSPSAPWDDLQRRLTSQLKFAVVARFPGTDSLYYPIPSYASLFKGSWYNIKRLIGVAKESKLKNAAPIKYIISVSPRYWEDVFKNRQSLSHKEKQEVIRKRKLKMMQFLTTAENSGSVLFTGKTESIDGRGENPYITVTSIDSKVKEGGDWESDIAEAINMICFTMHVHSNLVGSVPGKAQTNNSGSDKRELYTIAQALQKPYHDILFTVHNIIIRYNDWYGAYPECPFIQLTTLDEHRDAKEVSL